MKRYKLFLKTFFVLSLLLFTSCNEYLNETNLNPNGVDPATANPNLLLPTILSGVATSYLNLGYGRAAGIMQHTQHDGWYGGYNHYDWSPEDWIGWYNILTNNETLNKRAVELKFKFHEGISLTMRAFIFGIITDLWGDAPYTNALKGAQSSELLQPSFDSQEVIYKGIINDLKKASELFASKDVSGMLNNYDIYYNGNIANWQKFANSLLLRYYMRISVKLPSIAKPGIEAVYNSGIYLKVASEDAVMDYIGAIPSNSWPAAVDFDLPQSNFRRIKPAKTLIDMLKTLGDPRLTVWFAPVHVRWVADNTLVAAVDQFIRKDGVVMSGTRAMSDVQFLAQKTLGFKFTRHYNPTKIPASLILETAEYVGVPHGSLQPDGYNNNPTPGQNVENQHVSQLASVYRGARGGLLKARLASSSETSSILAEAAKIGYSVGSAETHYNSAIKNSLDTWGVGGQYTSYIGKQGVAFNNSIEQILTQKWIASWTMASESWFDFRRTGIPALKAGEASAEPVLPVRFIYGDNELNFNNTNVNAALNAIEVTAYSRQRGKNSQWSKPWLIKGTGKPW